jgi:hypothetical protein
MPLYSGFNAIDADNLDVSDDRVFLLDNTLLTPIFQSYTNSNGLLNQTDNLALAKLLADHAHSLGLAIAQKNTADLGTTGKLTVGFDFAIAEQCQEYGECCTYSGVYGTSWVDVEYDEDYFDEACTNGESAISVILRDEDVVANCDEGYVYKEC